MSQHQQVYSDDLTFDQITELLAAEEDLGFSDQPTYDQYQPPPFAPQLRYAFQSNSGPSYNTGADWDMGEIEQRVPQYAIPTPPPVIRPTPRSAFVPLRPNPSFRPPPPQSRPAPSQSSFPIPYNGNKNRRADEHLRPAGGMSIFQPGAGGNYDGVRGGSSSQAGASVGGSHSGPGMIKRRASVRSQEDDYFGDDGDDGFEQELGMMDVTVPQRFGGPAQIRGPQQQYQSPQFQRYDSPPSHQRPYEPIRPQPVPNRAAGGVRLRPVSDLPDMFRSLWKFGVFNAVQSTCFDMVSKDGLPWGRNELIEIPCSELHLDLLMTSDSNPPLFLRIYQSDRNVMISAPTGAGKTVLFELAILRLFSTTSSYTKVVYIAPTKSLCSERTSDWKSKFAPLGWDVVELTGDTTSLGSLRDIGDARIVVTTPEKWDVVTRRWRGNEKIMDKFKLFCIDEIHFVGMDVRGAVLEVVVSRMKTLGTKTRFIALSATVPNIEDVATWLSNEGDGTERIPAKVFTFGEEFRPCKLHKIVAGYEKRGDNDFVFQATLNYKLMDLISQHASGKAVLIFCNTRKACATSADVLAKTYQELLNDRKSLPWPKPPKATRRFVDKTLAALVEVGIAFHHAGLDSGDRRAVEQGFIEGSISVVCATSTLAVGINLPARMVIVKGTTQWIAGVYKEYDDVDMLQMMGRAGRPQFDTIGVACIMTDNGRRAHYEALVNSQTILESCLHKNLTEHINSELNLRTISSVSTAIEWLRSTFLFVRIVKNPTFYALNNGSTAPEVRLEEICTNSVQELIESGVVEEEGEKLTSNRLGDILTRYYLSHSTFKSLQAVPLKSNMRTLLETVSSCVEFKEIRFRQGEKGPFGKINKTLRFPTTKVTDTPHKVMIIIGMVLQGIPFSEIKLKDSNPTMELTMVWKHAARIVKCLIDLQLEASDGGVKVSLELLRSITAKAWDDSPFVLRQVDGIGEKSIKVLTEKGIVSFKDIYQSSASRLELLLNRNPPFGRNLIAQARSLPEFSVQLSGTEAVVSSGVKITLHVELGLVVTKPPAVLSKGRKKYWVTILLVTSDGEYIEFRRLKADQLVNPGGRDFTISVILVKPSQKIFVIVACEELAGSSVKSVYKPKTLASQYPLPGFAEGSIEEQEISDDEPPAPSPTPKQAVKIPRLPTPRADLVLDSPTPARAPVKLANGNYACNHRCSNKIKCRHFCCKDGLAKPPAQRKKSKPNDDDDDPAINALLATGPKDKHPSKQTTFPLVAKRPAPTAPRPISPRLRHSQPSTSKGLSVADWLDDSDSDSDLPGVSEILAPPGRKAFSLTQHAKKLAPIVVEEEEIDELDSDPPTPPAKSTLKRHTSSKVAFRQPKRWKASELTSQAVTIDASPALAPSTPVTSSTAKRSLFIPSSPPSASPPAQIPPRIVPACVLLDDGQESEDGAGEDNEASRRDEDEEDDFDDWIAQNVTVLD